LRRSSETQSDKPSGRTSKRRAAKEATSSSKGPARSRKLASYKGQPDRSASVSSSAKPCKDCGSTTRPRTKPGPRCATCHREVTAQRALARRLSYVAVQYNLTPEQYQALLDACPRHPKTGKPVCMGCQRNQPRCVDHDHRCCPGKVSCGKCVRGLLCNPCNKGVLGHLRDDVEALYRLADYVNNPPAQAVLFAA
jgi:hypothetical protein